MDELPEVRAARLKLKAAKPLIRDLLIAVSRAEEALDRQAHDAQPREGKAHDHEVEARCVA